MHAGRLEEDFAFLPARTIPDPSQSKPADWVEERRIPDPSVRVDIFIVRLSMSYSDSLIILLIYSELQTECVSLAYVLTLTHTCAHMVYDLIR